jgi:NADH dehydrogenase (ubiquinone) Fe-S protein 5
MSCYVINQNDVEARAKGVCAPRLEDYYECLHHKKEVKTPLVAIYLLYRSSQYTVC